MLVDSLLRFSNAQAITSAADSTSYVDLGAARDIGVGKPIYLVGVVTTAFTDASSNSTLDVVLEGDSTTTFTPDASRTMFTFAALSAVGVVKYAVVEPDFFDYRYLQVSYSPNNGDLSTGAVTCFLTDNIAAYQSFADGFTIS